MRELTMSECQEVSGGPALVVVAVVQKYTASTLVGIQ